MALSGTLSGGAFVVPQASPRIGWNGVSGITSQLIPSDSTGAIGLTRYVELTNGDYAIYTRGHRRIAEGSLRSLAGLPAGPNDQAVDPQIIWDPTSRRFYYVVLDPNATHSRFFFGFSSNASPNGPGSWCKYFAFDYGSSLPDQPHLGDMNGDVFWGTSVFPPNLANPSRSDVDWFSKPRSRTGCPDGSSVHIGTKTGLRTPSGAFPWRPTGVNQIDPARSGWLVASNFASGDHLYVYQVRRNGQRLLIQQTGTPVRVPAYGVPPNAPQSGSSIQIDLGDGSIPRATSAYDPLEGTVGVWMAQTVKGGAGDMVRWYEVNPGHAKLLRSNFIYGKTLDVFNAAISPDRVVNAHHAAFGADWVMGLNTSSRSTDIRIWAATKFRLRPPVVTPIHASNGPVEDIETGFCTPACSRWGDFSGASPDPAVPVRGHHSGRVWLTNGWDVHSTTAVNWRTWNWSMRP